jgi:hydrogenase maturation protease
MNHFPVAQGDPVSILVLGIGNPIMSDDAVGGRIVELLQQHYRFPPEVQLLDGDTLGTSLLHHLEWVENLLVVDAVETGSPPGTLIRLANDEIPRVLAAKLSPHQMGLSDLLAVAALQGCAPQEVVVWGIQPASVDMGLDLSPPVAGQMESLTAGVLEELRRWGIVPVQN